MRTNVQIRLARIADAYRIATMSRELIEHGLPQWSWTPERVVRAIRDRETIVVVAEAHRAIIGFAIMEYGKEEAHLDLLGVARNYQRTGIGRRLLEWLEGSALVAGVSVVRLEVRAVNTAAQAFYRSRGYRPVCSVARYYCGEEAAVRMARDLWAPAPTQAT